MRGERLHRRITLTDPSSWAYHRLHANLASATDGPIVEAIALRRALLGIDLGTSSVKVVAIDPDGAVLGFHALGYPTATPRPGWSEQDPEDWWQAVGEACRAVLAATPIEVMGIGLSGQMHTFVLVGEAGRVLRPAITWMDTRAESLLRGVRTTIARTDLTARLANPVVLGLTLPPLIWLRDHEPDAIAASRTLLVAKDYVRYRLTGEIASEPTDASATLLFDVSARRWSGEVMHAFGLSERLLPPIGMSDAVAGGLVRAAAVHLGLPPGVPVAFGAGDQQAAAVGIGTVRAGQAHLTVGTGAQVLGVREAATPDPLERLHTFCHVRDWVAQASVNNAGSALSWVRRVLGEEWDDVYGGLGDGDGPLFDPYLSGERTPLMKGHARGAWVGLSGSHERSDLARAAGEGVVVAIADAIATLDDAGALASPLRSAGGGMRDARFAQAIADASGQRIEVREAREASAMGAAWLAGIAVGALAHLDDVAARVGRGPGTTYEPRPERAEAWAAKCRTLRDLDAFGFHEVVDGRDPRG